MIPLGLSRADERTYRASLTDDHRMRVRVALMNLAGEHVHDITDHVDDGQVDIDSTAEVTRALTLQLHDVRRSMPFDTDSPSKTALFLDRMIRVAYQILVGDEWVSCPVFTGPITKLDRDGDTVTVEAQGKETLFLGAAWHPITLHKGMQKTDAIQRLLTEANPAYSETRIDFPNRDGRLPKAISLVRDDQPWLVADRIARSMGMQLFYDGRGVCRLRRRPKTVGLTFTGSSYVVSPPQISYSGDVVNAVIVRGRDPKGPANQVVAFAVAPYDHQLAPHRIGRYLLPGGQVIHDDKIKTQAEAETRAQRRLEDGLRQAVDVSFDSIPVPFLDPGDLCHVHTDETSVTFRLRKFSLPLVAGEPMAVGYHRESMLVHRRGGKRRNRK